LSAGVGAARAVLYTFTDTGSVLESPDRYRTMMKSSITSAKTRTALAKIAGSSIFRSTRRTAPNGDAPRSMAASS
jgi:hypothetical protein